MDIKKNELGVFCLLTFISALLFPCCGSQLKTFCHMNETLSCSAFSFSCNNMGVINVTDVWYRPDMSCDTNFCCCQAHINWTVNWSENHTQDVQALCNGNASCDVENYLKNMTGKITVMYSCETSPEEDEPASNSTDSPEQTSTSQITPTIVTATHSLPIIIETSSLSLSTPADTTSNEVTMIVSDTSSSAGTPDTSINTTSMEASANGNTTTHSSPIKTETSSRLSVSSSLSTPADTTSSEVTMIVSDTNSNAGTPDTSKKTTSTEASANGNTNCDSKIVTAVLVSVCLTAFIMTFLFLLKRHTNCRTRRRQKKVNTHVEIANNMYEDLNREETAQENVYSQANPEMS